MEQTYGPELQRLLDREAIRDCLTRYARGLDRHDQELLYSAFHEDAVDHHGVFVGRPQEFVPWALEEHERHLLAHQHFLANNTVEIEGDVAHSETYVFFVLRRKDDTGVDMGGGRYLDRLERRNGEWKIAQRELIMEWHGTAPSEAYADVLTYPTGKWGPTDPSYKRPFELTPPPGSP
jgi:hypothetical protein